MQSEIESEKAYRMYRRTKKYRMCALLVPKVLAMRPFRLNRFVDFEKTESRWEFTAIVFGLSLFLLSLFPTLYMFLQPASGGVLMTPFVVVAWVCLTIGIIGILFTLVLGIYFRGAPRPVNSQISKDLKTTNTLLRELIEEIRQGRNERNQSGV